MVRSAEDGILGVVLVGGASRRMSTPKQLLFHRGAPLAARAVEAMRPHVEQVVLAGSGPVPNELEELHRLPDPPDLAGPLAGVLAAMRWAPGAAWVVAACDMPRISRDAVLWLIHQRRPGTWGVLPRSGEGRIEPLLAVYEPHARSSLENQASAGRWGLRHLAESPRIRCPKLPAELAGAWVNVNTLEEMSRLQRSDVS